MKTLLHPIHSLSRVLHDSADVALGNQIFGSAHNLLNTQLQEEGNSFIVSVPVPGMSKEDLTVHTDGRILVVSTKGQGKISENKGASKCRDFKHSFVLPEGIDTNRIQAKCRNGLLTITIEKIKTKKRHTIIKVSGKDNDVRNTLPVHAWWEKIKEKVDLRKFIQKHHVMKTVGN